MDRPIKELLCLSVGSLSDYIEKNIRNSDLQDLFTLLKKENNSRTKPTEVKTLLDGIYSRLSDITDGQEVECNHLNLVMNCVYLIHEYNGFKGSSILTVRRLIKNIEPMILKNGDSIGVKRAYELFAKLDERYRNENI